MANPTPSRKTSGNRPSGGLASETPWASRFAIVFGCVLGIALLKFGNPVVLDRLIEPPNGIWELIFQPWPVRWGYALLAGCFLLALPAVRLGTPVSKWMVSLPFAWFGWQLLSSAQTVDGALTRATVAHFLACVVCFGFGLLVLAHAKWRHGFWIPILIAFLFVLWMGFEQHYGGLEATRKLFYEQPNWQQAPPEYLKKIQSNRIFSTLIYPNALAASILLYLPPVLLMVWRFSHWLTGVTRGVLVGGVGYAGIACLYWSGSKSGWLIGLILVIIVLLRQPLPKAYRAGILALVVLVGVTGFFVKFASYFNRGAPSVSARFQYWRAAVTTTLQHPGLGTGPGTFAVAYRRIKPPDAEMAQLTHNDYLEQASDSGILGLLTYAGFIVGSIYLIGRSRLMRTDEVSACVWIGLLGWSLQGFVEFLLYVPALAWPAFAFIGCLLARSSMGSTPETPSATLSVGE